MQSYDVAIVGGGMIGLTLALAMQDSGLDIALIDAEQGDRALGDQPELRVSAISLASEQVLKNLGAWDGITSQRHQAYQHMHVWDQDSFANIHFDHSQVHTEQLGYIIENQGIRRALWKLVETASRIDLLAPKKISKLVFGQRESFITFDDEQMLSARLVVGADGANSLVRKHAALPLTFWDYDQQAIVATVKTQRPHGNTARQVFTPSGPLAFLPLYEENLCSIVWSQQVRDAESLMALSEDDFGKALTAAFGATLGCCELVSARQSYPLKMRYARQWVKDRIALVGDAAHTIHPLAGQGANLGILDAAALAETLLAVHAQGGDIGEAKQLRNYERWRKAEALKMVASMEGFKRLFAGDNPVKKLIRGVGLSAVDKLPFAKHKIIQQAMGLEGELPQLAKSPTSLNQ